MSRWHSWALAILSLAAFLGLCVYLRTRPLVSDDELHDAGVEVARIRAVLDAAECLRPAAFGTSSETALPLREFLRLDGPLAACWSVDAPECSALPEQLERQAQAPDRCVPDGEVGAYDHVFDSRRHPFIGRVIGLADSGDLTELTTDERFRVLVQGMVVGRDLTQGATGFDQAHWGVEIETRLGAAFAELLAQVTPSAEARGELEHALGVLADMPTDANLFLSGEAAVHAVGSLRSAASGGGMMSPERMRWMAYGQAAFLSHLQEWCPPGGSVSRCVSRLPSVQPTLPSALPTQILGERALRRKILEYSLWSCSFSYADELRELEGLRAGARTLRRPLRHSGLEETP